MSERISEVDLQRGPKPEEAAIIAARLGRRIQRSEAFDAEGAAEVLLPHVTATIIAMQRLVVEVRRLRALIAASADPQREDRPGMFALTDEALAEARAIREEQDKT